MSEAQEVKRDGAKAQKNSGRGQIRKGDAVLGPFTVDYKEAIKSFNLNTRVWAKVCTDSFKNKNLPALKIILGEGDHKTRLFIITEDMMYQMLEAWQEKNGMDE